MDYTMRYLKNKKATTRHQNGETEKSREHQQVGLSLPHLITIAYLTIENQRQTLLLKMGGGGNHLSYKDKNYNGLFRNQVVRKCGLKY